MYTFPAFIMTFGGVATELATLLERRYIPGDPSNYGPVGVALASVLQHQNNGDFESRDQELVRLAFLAKHLREIGNHDAQLLAEFRGRMLSNDLGQYFGARAEIYVAASLIRAGVSFRRAEHPDPDFLVTHDSEEIGIECGSTLLLTDRTGDLRYKIGSAINRKAGKPYCRPTTVMFVDITNVLFNSIRLESPIDMDDLRTFVSNELDATAFGAAVLLTYVLDSQADGIRGVYIRVDAQQISGQVRSFLDAYYPRGDYFVENPGVFSRG